MAAERWLKMDIATYAVEAAVEEQHWWFVGRRRLFAMEIVRLGLSPDAEILDVGTSTGTNLRMLKDLGFRNVAGLDFSEESVRWCAEKGLPKVHRGDVCRLPFASGTYDLVLATDIIEHVDDDDMAVREIARVLKPGGYALFTVPTFPSLWGLQDEVAHHKRRYCMRQLVSVIAGGGLSKVRNYYFNFLLFAPIWLARRLIAMSGKKLNSEAELNSPLMNKVLLLIFRLDLALAPMLKVPFGVSALVLAQAVRSGPRL